ncbi:unnamed protein product [Mytilus edulis]|uniref:Uncharacterized protein n=1 Tax=Mytilus edulis TaxID=6550 RepID=A0A8S3PTN2_MYTED|nr:unnamed protein product [Mytilus edulis]
MIRFTEEEANTSDIARKVREQTSAIEDYILTDGKGNEIYDSEATRGLVYWKQNARKNFALLETDFLELSNNRTKSQTISATSVDGVSEKLVEIDDNVTLLLEKTKQLEDISSAISGIYTQVESRKKYAVPTGKVEAVRSALTCIICKAPGALFDKACFFGVYRAYLENEWICIVKA